MKIRDFKLKYRQKQFSKKYNVVNENISIFTNNCFGGFLYHDAQQKFLTPLVNTFLESKDYLIFLENIDFLNDANLIEIENTGKSYPVGLIKYRNGNECIIYFVHYKNFNDAKTIFFKRCQRIVDNRVAICFFDFVDESLIERFKKINLKKVCVYCRSDQKINDSTFIKCSIAFKHGNPMEFVNFLSAKVYAEKVACDFYEFTGIGLSRNKIEKN